MSEMTINLPVAANDNPIPKGEIGAFFEDSPQKEEPDTGFQHKNWIQRSRMTPDELHQYINDYRSHIANEIEKAA